MFDRRLIHATATAKHGSFTAAAQSIGVTQSAITKSIGDLEQQLGYQLFHRTPRGVVETDQGRIFLERMSRLLDEANEAMGVTAARNDPFADVLRVGVCPSSLEWLLMEPITLLLERHPNIRVNISGGTFDRVAQQLRNGVVDVALGFDIAFADHPDFKRVPLPPLRTTLFVRHGHPLANLPSVEAVELARYVMISPSDSRPYGTRNRHIFESQGIPAHRMMHVIDYFPIMQRVVSRTNAIGVVELGYSRTKAFASRFSCFPIPEQVDPAPLCCATRLRWTPRPVVRAFVKVCKEMLVDRTSQPQRNIGPHENLE